MRYFSILIAAAMLMWLAACASNAGTYTVDVTEFPTPDDVVEQGYAKGVSGAFAAVVQGDLILAGGCNFPEVPAAEGGAKRFYQGIYRYSQTDTTWHCLGMMPEPMAYGVAVAYDHRMILVGGANADGASRGVYILNFEADTLQISPLASLPATLDNAAGAVLGNRLYVVGGNYDGAHSRLLLSLDLSDHSAQWQVADTLPDFPRVQPTCAALDGKLLIMGGFAPASDECDAVTHTDGYLWSEAQKEWTLMPSPTDAAATPVSLSGGVATAFGDALVALGGVNKDIFTDAISGRYQLVDKAQYMLQEPEWYRFNPNIFLVDASADAAWTLLATDSRYARAGAAIAAGSDAIYYVGGELKPGIRIPTALKITISQQ